jgi:tripartite-type tricarboxylate transporter receptor subunit TctC
VTYSTPGSGSSNHLAALLLEQQAGIKMTHVAYKGGGPMVPDVPTLSETYPGFEQISWFGILGPARMPREVVARVHRDMVRTLRAPEVQQRLTDQGFDIVASSPEEFVSFVQKESDKLGRLIRDNKIVTE